MNQPENHIRLLSSARTDKGQVRQNNEDSIDLWEAGQYVLAVVADGMGGAVAGEQASKIAIETVRDQLIDDFHKTPEDYAEDDEEYLIDRLVEVIKRANLNIREKAINFPKLKGMGTTMTLAFARRSELNIVHVGDSRAYQVDGFDGSIKQLTSDHSFVQALVDAGHITPEEAETHPMKNVLYRALGQDQNVDVDSYTDLHLNIGDRLVLCSDGLTLHVRPEEIADTVMTYTDPTIATQKLLELANSRGGKDNISVIVVKVEASQKIQNESAATMEDIATVPIAPIFFEDTDTIEVETLTDDPKNHNNSRPIFSSAYGEGTDTNEPSQ